VDVALAAQLRPPLGPARLSHDPPASTLHTARALALPRSPKLLGLAYHELHHPHRRPDVPCQRLDTYRRRGGPKVASTVAFLPSRT